MLPRSFFICGHACINQPYAAFIIFEISRALNDNFKLIVVMFDWTFYSKVMQSFVFCICRSIELHFLLVVLNTIDSVK